MGHQRKALFDIKQPGILRGHWLENFPEDAIRVSSHQVSVVNNTIIDSVGGDDAHRDGLQLIPPPLFPRSQYAGATQEGVSVWCNHFRSRGKMQCIFSSDGTHKGLEVIGNVMETAGQWFIALRGVLDARIESNEISDGRPAPIWFGNLRIGGGANVYILSFANGLEYMPYQDMVDEYAWSAVTDLRGKIENPRHRHVANFDLCGYQEAAAEIVVPDDIPRKQQAIWHGYAMGDLACEFGDLVSLV